MALVVEDGTGKSDADAYDSLANIDAYHTNLGNAGWTGTDAVKEIAIKKGTRYLDLHYGRRWRGSRSNETQALDWPRTGVTDDDSYSLDSDSMPADLLKACAEASLRALTETLIEDIDEPGTVVYEFIKVGPIEERNSYSGGKSQTKRYPLIDYLLAALTVHGSRMYRG
jgi:hypothetical protein